MPADGGKGLLDTNILILRNRIEHGALPAEVAISAVSLAELSAGVHQAHGPEASAERARRLLLLQQVESEFDPLAFDAAAARHYGRIAGAVSAAGRSPRRRVADLMIAAVAAAHQLPLYTTNPADFSGLGEFVEVVAVPRPHSEG